MGKKNKINFIFYKVELYSTHSTIGYRNTVQLSCEMRKCLSENKI